MNLHVVQIIALDDCMRLLESLDETCEAFKASLQDARLFALMGETSGLNERLQPDLLRHCQSAWNVASESDGEMLLRVKQKLALALGAMAASGLKREGRLYTDGRDALYRAAFLFRLYYVKKADSGPDADTVYHVWKAMRTRNLIEMHTFVPNKVEVDPWFEEMNEWDRQAESERDAFAEACADANKLQRYAMEQHFYGEESILHLLAQLRQEQKIDQSQLVSALNEQPESIYAKAILHGLSEMRKANAQFTGSAVEYEESMRRNDRV